MSAAPSGQPGGASHTIAGSDAAPEPAVAGTSPAPGGDAAPEPPAAPMPTHRASSPGARRESDARPMRSPQDT